MILELITLIMWEHGFFIFFIPLACCLRVLDVQVPEVIDIRDAAVLKCKYDLEGDVLFSVKWYKEELEFFRYMPQNIPKVQKFAVDGVHVVTERESDGTVIRLNPLEYKSSGYYKCEVSSERPHFKTDFKGANMTVLGLPREEPKIEGVESPRLYFPGDYVSSNCTTSPSNPPADVQWYINEKKADNFFIESYKSHSRDGYNLTSKTLALRFRIETHHFADSNHMITLQCQAIVAGRIRSRVSIIRVSKSMTNQKLSQDMFNEGARTVAQRFLGLFILLLKLL